VPDLVTFCGEHNLQMITIADLIRYRLAHDEDEDRDIRAIPAAAFNTKVEALLAAD